MRRGARMPPEKKTPSASTTNSAEKAPGSNQELHRLAGLFVTGPFAFCRRNRVNESHVLTEGAHARNRTRKARAREDHILLQFAHRIPSLCLPWRIHLDSEWHNVIALESASVASFPSVLPRLGRFVSMPSQVSRLVSRFRSRLVASRLDPSPRSVQ